MVVKTTSAPVRGNRVWYFVQAVDAELGAEAVLPAFQTSGTTNIGGENIDEQTKQGRIILKSTDEHSVELEQYFTPNDPSSQVIKDAKVSGASVKVWRVIVDESVAEGEPGSERTYPAQFGYGLPDELSYDDGDGLVTVSYTLNIIGALKDGRFPLTDEDIAVIDSLYEYQNPGDTTGDYTDITAGE